MFTKQQLQILIEAQSGDDLTVDGFLDRVVEEGQQSDITGSQFDELMALLERFTDRASARLADSFNHFGQFP